MLFNVESDIDDRLYRYNLRLRRPGIGDGALNLMRDPFELSQYTWLIAEFELTL